MPISSKCWYRDCSSQSHDDSKLFFYRFPKDPERCEQWVHNCSNPDLTKIYNTNPDKFSNLRICQKHFLREFLGTSSRLVGHAVPAPFGTAMNDIEAEKFMVGCANLKTSSHGGRVPRYHSQPKNVSVENNNIELVDQVSTTTDNQTSKQALPMRNLSSSSEPSNLSILTNGNHLKPSNDITIDSYQPESLKDFSSALIDSELEQFHTIEGACNHQDYETSFPSLIPESRQAVNATIVNSDQPATTRLNGHANPKINYDKEGRVVSIQYPNETLSLIQKDDSEQYKAHIVALKYKIRHYQRKLAVINHRYQKLRSQVKGRSNRMRLLESLKNCQGDFNPCIFELFKRQIKGPSSKHGNRWSQELKAFSSSIYLQSRSAYRIIRKTIDLPSEFIVKQYIAEKKLSKPNKSATNIPSDEEGQGGVIATQDREIETHNKEATISSK